jgi:tetratricopeptide (TPR) repeat protein
MERVGQQRLSRYRFRHNLFQHYLYHSLDELDRSYLHEAVGNVLELLFEGHTDEVAVQLAWHFQEAGLVAKAVGYLQSAGDGNARVYAYSEAIASYRQALSLIKEHNVSQEHLIHLYSGLGRMLELNSQFDEALATYEEMARMAQKLGNRPMELASFMDQVTLYSTPTPLHDPVKGPALGQETLALARELGDQAAEAKTLWNLALGGMWSGRTHEGIAYAEQAAILARQLNLTELLAYSLNDLGMLYAAVLDVENAIPTLNEAGRVWRQLNNLPMVTDNLSMTAMALVAAGDYKLAIELSDEAFQISESHNNLWGQSYSRMMVCLAYWEFGSPDQALSMANESIRLGKLAGFIASQVMAGGYKAAFLGNLGAINQGLEVALEAVDVAETQFPHFRCHPLGVLVQLHLMAGNLDEAEALVEQGKSDAYREAHPTWNMRINIAEAALALKQSNHEKAIAITDLWLPRLRQNNLRAYTPTMLQLKSKAQLAMGQAEAARVSLLEAKGIAETIGARATLWPILFALSHLETNPASAQQLHKQAQGIVEIIAIHIGTSDLRNSFLNQPNVRELFA